MTAEKDQLGPSRPRKRRPIQEIFVDQEAAAKEAARPVKMFNVRMDLELHKRLKDYAYRTERSMKEVVEESLRDFLDKHES